MKRTNKEHLIIYLVTLIFSCTVLWGFLSNHYATDTYKIIGMGYDDYALKYWLKDGRVVMAIVGFLANIVKIPINSFVIILTFLGIAISSYIVLVLYKIILKYKPTNSKYIKLLLLAISYVTIFNFMYLENLYFVDCFAMSISVLVYILAAHILCEKNKYYFIKSLLLVIAGIFSYQATISVFIAFTILFTILKNANSVEISKKVLKDILEMVVILIASVLLNLLFAKIISTVYNLEQNRISGIQDIVNNIMIILGKGIYITLIDTCGLYPTGAFLAFLIITIITFFVYNHKKSDSYKNLWIIIFVLLAILSAFAINILSVGGFFSGRMRFVIGAVVGMIYIFMYVKTDIFKEKSLFNVILTTILSIYLVTGILVYMNNINIHKKNNIVEENEANILNSYIKQYEEEQELEIKYLAVIFEKGKSSKSFSDKKYHMVLNYNALRCDWSAKETINFYTGRNLLRVYEKFDKEMYNTFINSGLEYMCMKNILYYKVYVS